VKDLIDFFLDLYLYWRWYICWGLGIGIIVFVSQFTDETNILIPVIIGTFIASTMVAFWDK